jgi:hypothetical protein
LKRYLINFFVPELTFCHFIDWVKLEGQNEAKISIGPEDDVADLREKVKKEYSIANIDKNSLNFEFNDVS